MFNWCILAQSLCDHDHVGLKVLAKPSGTCIYEWCELI